MSPFKLSLHMYLLSFPSSFPILYGVSRTLGWFRAFRGQVSSNLGARLRSVSHMSQRSSSEIFHQNL